METEEKYVQLEEVYNSEHQELKELIVKANETVVGKEIIDPTQLEELKE